MTWLTPAEQRADLALAAARFHTELGKAPDLFAYPYGEISQTLRRNVAEAGFTAAFGQHSGAAGALADHLALPRFPLNETYGALDRFRLRSEEHTSELQSLMRISYAVFCLK